MHDYPFKHWFRVWSPKNISTHRREIPWDVNRWSIAWNTYVCMLSDCLGQPAHVHEISNHRRTVEECILVKCVFITCYYHVCFSCSSHANMTSPHADVRPSLTPHIENATSNKHDQLMQRRCLTHGQTPPAWTDQSIQRGVHATHLLIVYERVPSFVVVHTCPSHGQ